MTRIWQLGSGDRPVLVAAVAVTAAMAASSAGPGLPCVTQDTGLEKPQNRLQFLRKLLEFRIFHHARGAVWRAPSLACRARALVLGCATLHGGESPP